MGYGPEKDVHPDISEWSDNQIRNISVTEYWKCKRIVIRGKDRILATWSVSVPEDKVGDFCRELMIQCLQHVRIEPTEFLPHYYVYAPPEAMRKLVEKLPYINKVLPVEDV